MEKERIMIIDLLNKSGIDAYQEMAEEDIMVALLEMIAAKLKYK